LGIVAGYRLFAGFLATIGSFVIALLVESLSITNTTIQNKGWISHTIAAKLAAIETSSWCMNAYHNPGDEHLCARGRDK
jgi:hypothetical protein